jgi:hypothetical protein
MDHTLQAQIRGKTTFSSAAALWAMHGDEAWRRNYSKLERYFIVVHAREM